jgi:Cysteine-rich CPCC
VTFENVVLNGNGPYACPCCRFLTLSARGADEICQVCFWEDDGQDDHDADEVRGGPNGNLSLASARANFRNIGAWSDTALSHVRAPRPEEVPNSDPWFRPDAGTSQRLANEALREIGVEHALWGLELSVIAKCGGCDRILVTTEDGSTVVIHLTWARHPEPNPWPTVDYFRSIGEALQAHVH